MQLCELEIPDHVGRYRFGEARALLIEGFVEIIDVLPMTRHRTLAVVFAGDEQLERWAVALEGRHGAAVSALRTAVPPTPARTPRPPSPPAPPRRGRPATPIAGHRSTPRASG